MLEKLSEKGYTVRKDNNRYSRMVRGRKKTACLLFICLSVMSFADGGGGFFFCQTLFPEKIAFVSIG